MELHRAFGRLGGHVLLDHHAELDVIVAGIDLLAGEKAVERRILGDAAHIGREENVRDAEVRHSGAALFADVALDGADLHRLVDAVRRAASGGHDVVADHLYRVERAELAPVGAVAPGGMVGAVEVDLDAQRRDQPAEQHQQIRQVVIEHADVLRVQRRAAVIQQDAQPRQMHQRQHPRAVEAGDDDGVDGGEGHVRDPAQENVAPRRAGHTGDADAEVNGKQKDRNGRSVQALLTGAKKDQRVDQGRCDRQYDLKPHRRCVCAFPADKCDADGCRAYESCRCEPEEDVLPADIIRNSLFHGAIIAYFLRRGKHFPKKDRISGAVPAAAQCEDAVRPLRYSPPCGAWRGQFLRRDSRGCSGRRRSIRPRCPTASAAPCPPPMRTPRARG